MRKLKKLEKTKQIKTKHPKKQTPVDSWGKVNMGDLVFFMICWQ